MTHTGQCMCGQVTYKGNGKASGPHACHCDMCQRFVGSAFIGVDFENGLIEGPVHWFRSSDWGERGSCSTCGSALFWRLAESTDAFVASIGSLSDKSGIGAIESHYFADNIPSSYDFAGDAERLSREETLARFAGGTE